MIQVSTAGELKALLESDSAEAELRREADRVRKESVGDEVHLRGLIEISNICRCDCLYCGLRAGNTALRRYRLGAASILSAAQLAKRLGYGTVVLQSGDDPGADFAMLAGVVKTIKGELGLAVTLSLGELPSAELARLREAGADRYLLKHETANPALYARLKPGGRLDDRVSKLRELRRLGYQIGSGCMIGLPGQTTDDLVADLQLMRSLDVDMAGMGPFIPCPGTPLADSPGTWPAAARVTFTYRMMALFRLCCPLAMMPVTTALATLDRDARRKGLQCGANVIMPNVGDMAHRKDYMIYPGKAGVDQTPEALHRMLMDLMAAIGRRPGQGPGHSPRGRA